MGDHEAMFQLATRIPKELHRAVRLHCVKADVTVMRFVIEAIGEELKRDLARQRRAG